MSEMLILVKQLLISANVTVSKKLTFEKLTFSHALDFCLFGFLLMFGQNI